MDKQQKKIIQRRVGFSFLRLFVFINGLLPLHCSYILGSFLGNFAYLCIGRHRRISLEGLTVAFPQATLAEKKKITRDFFVFMAQGAFEMFYFLRNPSALTQVTVKGKEYLDQALTRGNGVIMVTGHIGNFPLMSIKLVQAGYKVSFVTARMRDEKAGDYLYTLRSNSGVKTIFSQPRRECVLEITKALRDNEIVIMQMDQNFGTGGVWVKFFGTLAATPTGPVTLGLRTGAAIVPAYIFREGEGKHSVRIFPQEELVVVEDKNETVLRNVARLTGIIEDWVREHPVQWGWIHRRWKSRPSDKGERVKFKIKA